MQSAQNQPSTISKLNSAHATEKLHQALTRHDYCAAAAILRGQGYSPSVRNNLGVCLLRTGQIDEALQVFRSFILDSGGVYERGDATDIARRNFATVLIVKQLPSGAFSVLEKTADQAHLRQLELLKAISQWESTLGWLKWLNWKINRVAPSTCFIKLDFELGEFEGFDSNTAAPKRAA